MLNLVPVDGGMLALTHRPKKKDLPAFRTDGITHVLTLLTEREGAKELGSLVVSAGLAWIWCPLDGANTRASLEDVAPALDAAKAALKGGGHVVVHCSAGVHRTGMFGYALLRIMGLEPPEARACLRALRPVTADGVGDERVSWGDQIAEDIKFRSK
jgi:hypothetical protein